jgi:hypothetical protein
VSCGAKPFETRSWAPPGKLIGRRIAIHAAKRPIDMGCLDKEIRNAIAENGCALGGDLPLGAFVCTAILSAAHLCGAMNPGNMVYVERSISRDGTTPVLIQADPFGDFSPGRWAWQLDDVRPLPIPVPATGRQGFWAWTPPSPSVSSLPSVRQSPAPGGIPSTLQE